MTIFIVSHRSLLRLKLRLRKIYNQALIFYDIDNSEEERKSGAATQKIQKKAIFL